MESEKITHPKHRFPLIDEGDPPPYKIVNEHGAAKVLLVADHASRALPKRMNRLGLDGSVLDLHVACDIGSGDVTRRLADRLDAPAVLAGYSRLLVDCNRRSDDPSAFIEVSDGVAVPGNLGLSEAEKALRIQSFYDPYHGAVASMLGRFHERGVTPALISIHSCTPVFDRIVRPWHIGILWDKDPRIALPFLEALRSRTGICVGDNEPYSGRHPHDFTIDHHAEAAGLPNLGIELRQDLIETRTSAYEWADMLADILSVILGDKKLYERLWWSTPEPISTHRGRSDEASY